MTQTANERFWSKVDRRGPDECWPWLASKSYAGYGNFSNGNKTVRAHRYSYEQVNGPIANGMTVDHTCHNEAVGRGLCKGGFTCPHRACVNQRHLEIATRRTNMLRGLAPPALAARKTHCPQGHPYNLLNTRIRPSGARRCVTCKQAEDKRRYARGKVDV